MIALTKIYYCGMILNNVVSTSVILSPKDKKKVLLKMGTLCSLNGTNRMKMSTEHYDVLLMFGNGLK